MWHMVHQFDNGRLSSEHVCTKSCIELHSVFPQPTADCRPDASSRVQTGWRESLPSTTSSTSRASNRDPEDDWSTRENWNHAFHQGRQKVVNREELGENIDELQLETTDLETTSKGTSLECHVSSVGIAWFNQSFGVAISFPFFRKHLKTNIFKESYELTLLRGSPSVSLRSNYNNNFHKYKKWTNTNFLLTLLTFVSFLLDNLVLGICIFTISTCDVFIVLLHYALESQYVKTINTYSTSHKPNCTSNTQYKIGNR